MLKKWYLKAKRNLKIIWLRFRKNCFKGSISYADRKLSTSFDKVLYDQRKRYVIKSDKISNELFNMRRSK